MKYSREQLLTIAFYNVENLFDTIDDPFTNDDKYTAKGERKWTHKRYRRKLKKISYVISQIGKKVSKETPVIVGLVEVENTRVLEDLVAQKDLRNHGYRYVHFDSKDERGIDTALLYRAQFFEPVSSKKFQFNFLDEDGTKDHTRDVLLVSGFLNEELVHIIVNHWPSRREGEEETRPKRIQAAKVVQKAVEEIRSKDSEAKIIIMGDFNDNPDSESIEQHLVTEDFYNPMLGLQKQGLGTLSFRKEWYLFDQIILSKNFKKKETEHEFLDVRIFNKRWLKTHKGKFKGSPFRTYIGPWYKGGFSDHFPIYATFLKK
ncbi:endonuclease/exonuclease/phosphatase family protein [Tenacibaculum sp. 190524A05c]|uniref:endonuclease/exonuclease/phosphatase family protein n=1 Tax=Tenacibaculum platacis TaxID=3137852 RepID=UPI0032B22AD5